MSQEYGKKLAFGGDSQVFLSPEGRSVVKRYDGGLFGQPLPFSSVERYYELTNSAFKHLQENPATLMVEGVARPIHINPATGIYVVDGVGFICSPFVQGMRITCHPEVREIRTDLYRFSKSLEKSLGYTGIEVTPGNAQIFEGTVVVTDLCACVRGLKCSNL